VSVAIFILLSLAGDWLRGHHVIPRGRVVRIEWKRSPDPPDGWACDVEGGC